MRSQTCFNTFLVPACEFHSQAIWAIHQGHYTQLMSGQLYNNSLTRRVASKNRSGPPKARAISWGEPNRLKGWTTSSLRACYGSAACSSAGSPSSAYLSSKVVRTVRATPLYCSTSVIHKIFRPWTGFLIIGRKIRERAAPVPPFAAAR
jgi:hypothetical protein